jgi:probable addiction module antidote protein
MKRKASAAHDETIIRRLRNDPDFPAEYLKAALEEEDEPRVLLIALRHLAQAQGIAKVAKAAGVERESLYRALSVHGNPRLSTLVAVTEAIGAETHSGSREISTPISVALSTHFLTPMESYRLQGDHAFDTESRNAVTSKIQ